MKTRILIVASFPFWLICCTTENQTTTVTGPDGTVTVTTSKTKRVDHEALAAGERFTTGAANVYLGNRIPSGK